MPTMDADSSNTLRFRLTAATTTNDHCNGFDHCHCSGEGRKIASAAEMKARKAGLKGWLETASFMKWRWDDVVGVVKYHPIPCFFAMSLLFFMGVEYTLRMVPSTSPPFDLGFVATSWLNQALSSRPDLNTFFAALNTVTLLFLFPPPLFWGECSYVLRFRSIKVFLCCLIGFWYFD